MHSVVQLFFSLLLIHFSAGISFSQSNHSIWFQQPATKWEEGLPIGNGRLGAMIFGGVEKERIQLNESSIWTGSNSDFVNPKSRESLDTIRELLFDERHAEAERLVLQNMMGERKIESNYQTMGDLQLLIDHRKGNIGHYKRSLDLQTAIAEVVYEVAGVTYTREMFSSAVDQVIVIHLKSSLSKLLNVDISMSRPGNVADIAAAMDNTIRMKEHVGNGNGVKFISACRVFSEDGIIERTDTGISVKAASSVTLLISASTNYKDPNYETICNDHLEKASQLTFDELKKRHIRDYQFYFNRVKFEIGDAGLIDQPTDVRLQAVQQGKEDLSLITLYYQFGRYLLISSSRSGGLPANLQGIWADGLTPPWNADYHININIQMNYWMAETGNLAELHKPFLEFVSNLIDDGKKTAREMYGMPGAVAHFTTDAWLYTETHGRPEWAMWPMGLTWCVEHLWQHYLFSEDKIFLREKCYPTMREVALFCKAWLTRDPSTGLLVSGPSISPENSFKTSEGKASVVMGPTMDHMLIRELFQNTIQAAALLGIDSSLRDELSEDLKNLSPTQIGHDGRILEWSKPRQEWEPGHRHISHLYGLYPGTEIAQDSVLTAAARKTLQYRLEHGGGHTGWSRAWIINFYARLRDGEKCYDNLLALLRKSTLSNLLDNHPPFQIDGNFGAAAGINEMLLQGYNDAITLLPALPNAWPEGHITGIRAQGGFTVDLFWKDHKLTKVFIHSPGNHERSLRYHDKVVRYTFKSDVTYTFDSNLKLLKVTH